MPMLQIFLCDRARTTLLLRSQTREGGHRALLLGPVRTAKEVRLPSPLCVDLPSRPVCSLWSGSPCPTVRMWQEGVHSTVWRTQLD